MSIKQNDSAQIGLIGVMLLLLVIVVIGVALNSVMMEKITPKFLSLGTSESNNTLNLTVSRGYNAIDFSGIGLPIAIALGFIIFMVLMVRNGGQGGQPQ